MSHIQSNKKQPVFELLMPAPPYSSLKHLFKTIFPPFIFPNHSQRDASTADMKLCLTKPSTVCLKDPVTSLFDSFSILPSCILTSSTNTSSIISSFSVSFHLSQRRDTCLSPRCCSLVTHSATSFTFPGKCYMLGEKSAHVTLHLFGLCEACGLCVCQSGVCIF